MPRPLKFGRVKQSSQNQQADKPPTVFPSPMFTGAVTPEVVEPSNNGSPSSTLTGALGPNSTEISRTVGPEGPHLLRPSPFTGDVPRETIELSGTSNPSSSLTEDLIPRTDDAPRFFSMRGFMYQKIDPNASRDATIVSNGQQVRQDSQRLSVSQALPLSSTSSGSHHVNVRSTQPAARNQSPETLQPTTADSSPTALSKPERTSKHLGKLKRYNKSPEPDSDSEQEESSLKAPHSSQQTRQKPQRRSLLLREIEAHNQSPEPESNLEVEVLYHLEDHWGNVPLTRSVRQKLVDVVKGEPSTPRKNLNFNKLMLAEFSGVKKGTKTFYAEGSSNFEPSSHQRQQGVRRDLSSGNEEDDEEEAIPGQVRNTVGNSQRDHKSAAELAWMRRDYQQGQSAYFFFPSAKVKLSGYLPPRAPKQLFPPPLQQFTQLTDFTMAEERRIIELVKTPGYHPHLSQQDIDEEARKNPAYHVTPVIPEGFQRFLHAFHIEQGLYVFTPTAADFLDFARFLKNVEEIAGREMGVVKVILPSECLSQTRLPSRSIVPSSPVLETMKISINRNASNEPFEYYDMRTTKQPTSLGADEWLQEIQRDKAKIIQKRDISTEAISRNDVWKESHVIKPFTERKMTQRSDRRKGAVLCALNELATPTLRAALNCRDPNIGNLLGNRFAFSSSTQPGINESVFHIARGSGPLSRLQMNEYAAYSLNYHHSGAPRFLTVTRPEHYAKLEEVIFISQNNGTLSGRPQGSRKCSQFVKHQPTYVPHRTLSVNDVQYTEVVQHQGEMVITFPYAYHQAYGSGPNITEEILYASDRCTVFHRENLYQYCDSNCAAGQLSSFDLKMVFSEPVGRTRSGRSGLELTSTLPPPRRSRQATTSQNRDADDRGSDDGEWMPPPALSGPQPSTPRKRAPRLTSNPYAPEIWDSDHAFGFGGPYGPAADNDYGSPIGGSQPRDIITGRLLGEDEWRARSSRKRTVESEGSEEAPRKTRRRRH